MLKTRATRLQEQASDGEKDEAVEDQFELCMDWPHGEAEREGKGTTARRDTKWKDVHESTGID